MNSNAESTDVNNNRVLKGIPLGSSLHPTLSVHVYLHKLLTHGLIGTPQNLPFSSEHIHAWSSNNMVYYIVSIDGKVSYDIKAIFACRQSVRALGLQACHIVPHHAVINCMPSNEKV